MKAMENYSLHLYTEIVFGKETENRVAELIRKYGGTRVMLIYGQGSIKQSGLYDQVAGALNAGGLPFAEFSGIKANPLRSVVEKGIETAQEFEADFFLGVGGGSVIDTAKAIALAMANDGEYWSFYNGVEPERMAPVGTVNTIAAAGSETSQSTVLIDDIDTGMKVGLFWSVCRPCFAIMNPELTYSVSKYQTAAGAADVFSHTFMRFFNPAASYLGDEFCIGLLRTVVKYAPAAIENPNDYEARAELMAAASFAHNDVTGIGKEIWSGGGEHPLEQQLSGYYDTAHGAGLAVMMPAMLTYILRHGDAEQIDRIAYFAARVFDSEPDAANPEKVAEDGINRFKAWLTSIGMPTTLTGLGVPEDDIRNAIDRCINNTGGKVGGYVNADADGIAEIYINALK